MHVFHFAVIELDIQVDKSYSYSSIHVTLFIVVLITGVALYCRDDIMPNKSEEGLSGLLNKKYSKLTENLIGNYGDMEENEKADAAMADDDGRSILTQHTVKVGRNFFFLKNGKKGNRLIN